MHVAEELALFYVLNDLLINFGLKELADDTNDTEESRLGEGGNCTPTFSKTAHTLDNFHRFRKYFAFNQRLNNLCEYWG